ncbi:MAG: N-acetyltransferase [Gammaproteobacteria bacterium]|nr:N-acetyltransferase [Gammaproteobacteria bacterium]MCP5136905.1 N-acetyltransferase [Gammaproteobacteria bacterium]
MSDIMVRPETSEDVRAIDVVNLSAFEGDREARLIDALRRSPSFVPELSLVAEFNGRIVGHLLLSKVELRRREQIIHLLELGPMSVVPSQSHRGIGTILIETAINQARERGFKAIVEVGQANYYTRFNFEPAAKWGLSCNLPVPDDAITAIELEAGVLNGGGHIIYPPQFNQLY